MVKTNAANVKKLTPLELEYQRERTDGYVKVMQRGLIPFKKKTTSQSLLKNLKDQTSLKPQNYTINDACPEPGCHFISHSVIGLTIHKSKAHRKRKKGMSRLY